MPSVNSCQRRSIILGMVELILLACKRVVLRDRNTLHSSSLARSAAPELSELLLPLLWRGFFFSFYMEIKLQDSCGFPSLLTSTVFLLSVSTWPGFPALGTGQDVQAWFLLPVTFSAASEGAEQMFSAWWRQADPYAHSRCKRSWHLLNRNLEMISSSLQQMSLS